jgi:hypothetical protein
MERQVCLLRMFPPCPVKPSWIPERNLVKTFVRCNLLATPTGMTSFLGHVVLITCIEVKHHENMNKWPYIAVPTECFLSGQWYIHTHIFHTKATSSMPPPPNNHDNKNQVLGVPWNI